MLNAIEHERSHPSITTTRNSSLRKITDRLVHQTALMLHQVLPDVTPNQITALGVVEVLAGVYLAEEANLHPSTKDKTLALLLETTGYICDALDGALARIIMSESPEKHDGLWGQLADVSADRTQEIGAALLRARTAYLKGSSIGEFAALSAAMTTTLPSLARAYVESQGYNVPEMGMSIFQAAGTRTGRIVLNTVASHLREVKGIPLQPAIDTFATAANLNNTITRLNILKDPKIKPTLEIEQKLEAVTRCKLLAVTEVVSLMAAPAAYQVFRAGI